MSQESIADIIRKRLLTEFLGKEKAKRRKILLSHCRYFEPGLSDRTMRRIYKSLDLPIGWCRKGIYVIKDIGVIKRMIKTEERAIESRHLQKLKLEAWRDKLIKDEMMRGKEAIQMRLFR